MLPHGQPAYEQGDGKVVWMCGYVCCGALFSCVCVHVCVVGVVGGGVVVERRCSINLADRSTNCLGYGHLKLI